MDRCLKDSTELEALVSEMLGVGPGRARRIAERLQLIEEATDLTTQEAARRYFLHGYNHHEKAIDS